MSAEFPEFRDRLLARVVEVVRRRRAVLRHQGVGVRYDASAACEWFALSAEHTLRARTELQLVQGNVAHLLIRSVAPRTRGRELARLDFLRVVDNAPKVVEAFEQTLVLAFSHHRDAALGQALDALWTPLQLRVLT